MMIGHGMEISRVARVFSMRSVTKLILVLISSFMTVGEVGNFPCTCCLKNCYECVNLESNPRISRRRLNHEQLKLCKRQHLETPLAN